MLTLGRGDPERGREIECGETENRRRQDNPAMAIVGLPREEEQGRVE